MITSIEIQGLRGIREGRIEGLAPLTILVGPNGCGKSTVLEAMGVVAAGPEVTQAFNALAGREWLGLAGIEAWFHRATAKVIASFGRAIQQRVLPAHRYETKISISIVEHDEHAIPGEHGPFARIGADWFRSDTPSAPTRSFVLINADGRAAGGWPTDPKLLPFALQSAFVDRPAGAGHRFGETRFSSALRDNLAAIKLSPWYDELFSYLQVLRPTLTSIESIAVGDRDEPHIFERDPKHGRMGYPLAYAGDGFRRSLLLAGTFARAKGGVAAIDEPEAFAHPGMFTPITGLIRRAVTDGTQVVLATHSIEFVAAVLRAFEDRPDDAAVVGLRMESGVLDPLVVAGPDAHQRVLEFGHDLRL